MNRMNGERFRQACTREAAVQRLVRQPSSEVRTQRQQSLDVQPSLDTHLSEHESSVDALPLAPGA